jgi:hypothetical protein
MIKYNDIGPRIFTRAEAAFEYRDEMGGRVFVPDAMLDEYMWFPMSWKPVTILNHRMTRGLSGQLVCDKSQLRKEVAA